MNIAELERLERQLDNRLPLIGGWVQRRAARKITQTAHSRQRYTPQAVAALVRVVERRAAPQATDLAKHALSQLSHQPAIRAFCQAWADSRSQALEKILLHKGYLPSQPTYLRLLVALKTEKIEIARSVKAEAVDDLLQITADRDPQIAQGGLQALSKLKDRLAQEAVCKIFIEEGNSLALSIARGSAYLPSDPAGRALFYLLSEQWTQYQAVDFDHRLLRAAYQIAPGPQRQRILEKIRLSGLPELLNAIAGDPTSIHDVYEANLLAQMLVEHKDWPRLWEKVFEFPYPSSLGALRSLAQADWQPSRIDEQAALVELIELANAPLIEEPAKLAPLLPPAVQRANANLRTGRINSITFAPRQPVIAVGSSNRTVAMWDFQHSQRQQLLSGFERSIGQVLYSADGQLLIAERTNSKTTPCSVYRLEREHIARIWQAAGSITALEALGDHQVFAGARDHQAVILDCSPPPGQPARLLQAKKLAFWPRFARCSFDQSNLALFYDSVSLFRLPDLQEFTASHYSKTGLSGVVRCAAFTPDNLALVVGNQNGRVEWLPVNFSTNTAQRLAEHPARLQGIETLPEQDLLVSIDASGEIQFTAWADRKMAGKIVLQDSQPNSLHISPDGSFMAIGHADAHLSLWDLRPLGLPALLSQPLSESTPNQLAGLDALLGAPAGQRLAKPAANSLNFLRRVLRHRFRYDIDIGEMTGIQVGEYDIEID
jgi:WD40 repeat protein